MCRNIPPADASKNCAWPPLASLLGKNHVLVIFAASELSSSPRSSTGGIKSAFICTEIYNPPTLSKPHKLCRVRAARAVLGNSKCAGTCGVVKVGSGSRIAELAKG